MILLCSLRDMFFNPCKNRMGYRSCFIKNLWKDQSSVVTHETWRAPFLCSFNFYQAPTASILVASLPCRLVYASGGREMFQKGPRTGAVVSDPGRERCCSLLAQYWQEKIEITHVGTMFLQVSPAIKTPICSAVTPTVLLHNQSDNSYTSQLLLNVTLDIHSRWLSEGLNVLNRNSSKNSCRQNAAFPGRNCPGNPLAGVNISS